MCCCASKNTGATNSDDEDDDVGADDEFEQRPILEDSALDEESESISTVKDN